MRTKLSARRSSIVVSLILQYFLVLSVTTPPGLSLIMAQQREKVRSTTATESVKGGNQTTEKTSAPVSEDSELPPDLKGGHIGWGNTGQKSPLVGPKRPWESGASDGNTLAQIASAKGEKFSVTDNSKFSGIGTTILGANLPPSASERAPQDRMPMAPPPPPGRGSGGTGPDGTFNVAPPERRQGRPQGVRSVSEVLNEPGNSPRIPAPIPSSQSYCWPGDPACRKPPQPKPPQAQPTPPPRPTGWNNPSTKRSSLLAFNNSSYTEKLLRQWLPQLSSPPIVGSQPREAVAGAEVSGPLSQTFAALPTASLKTGPAVSLWADCNNAQGYAGGAVSVYIYVDNIEVGLAGADWSGYFIYDISPYVNDGFYHNVSAWYYDWEWNWLYAGSSVVSGCFPNYDFDTPRLAPPNETGGNGVNPGSQNINWNLPLVSLPGRAGLDLDLTLTYNSLVWTKSADGAAIMFDTDHGFPSPGFRLRFPIIQPLFFNAQANVWSYMLVTSSGARIELRQVGTGIYESADNSYMRMIDYGGGNAIVWLKDGTQMSFGPSVNDELRCTQIKDRNGNFISVSYTPQGNINTVTDTLGRQIVFVYDANHRLIEITQSRTGLVNTLVTFGYSNATFSPSFPSLTVFAPSTSTIPVLTQVGFPNGRKFTFEYTTFGQVNKINRHEADNRVLSYTRYNLGTGSQSDCPRFSEERVWAENWNNNQEAVTTYSGNVQSGQSQVTTPDGVVHKQFYHTTGWRTGLVEKTETWAGGIQRKRTEMLWTQDDTNLNYQKNPRPTEINIFDAEGNRKRTTLDYHNYSLPQNIREWGGAAGDQLLRRSENHYRWDAEFINRHIIGLPGLQMVYEGESSLVSKIEYHYDWRDGYMTAQAPSVQHDTANYGSGFYYGRGIVVGVRRYNIQAPNDGSQATWLQLNGYDLAGSTTFVQDHVGHRISVGYGDAWSDGINSRNTLGYPTELTDQQGFKSYLQYHYDIGALTRAQDPKGAVQTTQYDTVGRLQRVTNATTNGYTRWEYTSVGEVVTLTQVDPSQPETLSVHYVDGGGRDRGTISHLPNSTGGWRAQMWDYDIMGRMKEQRNPTEVTQAWQPTGDDATGWVVTLQGYDWQGRPAVSTNPDGSTREATYSGCGCAGGDVVTIRDERGRRRRFTKDVLGRLVKVEELDWNQNIYSTTTYTYNARDQITQTNQAGQLRTFTYDGHGRLITRTTPEQGATNYTYNLDDTVHTVTDARTAAMTFNYNPRKLVEGITFSVPSGVAPTPNVTFQYDAAGNRTSMSSSESTVSYSYDTASRLTSETRSFNGVAGSFSLNYAYNQAGQLTEITNPWGVKVGYNYNFAGEVAGVSGQNYGGVSTYASGLVYRAFGGLKQMNYGNGKSLSLGYNNRMFLTQWNIPGVMGWNYAYNYFGENTGRVTYAQNLNDGTLDRSYNYDHVGRWQSGFTGSAARAHVGIGSSWLSDGPYAAHDNQYDVWGNTLSRTGWGGTNPQFGASYTNNRMNGMVYDAAGNLTDAGGGWTFTYDATGQQATSALYNLQQYFDGDRLRVKKVESGVATYYLRSSVLGGQVVAEINASGGWQRGYVYLDGQTVAVQQNGVYWMHEDPVAKSKRVTDSAGNVVSTIELDPWGGETNRSSNEAFQPKKFTSYERDVNGSDEAMHRRYNRWWGRFEQPDPYDGSYSLANPQSFNRYAYVQNDPVNFVDPTGLMCRLNYTFVDEEGGATYYEWTCTRGSTFTPWEPNDPPEPGEPLPTENTEPQRRIDRYSDCINQHFGNTTAPVPDRAAASLIPTISGITGVAPSLLAVTWAAESSFNLTPYSNPNDGAPRNADIGPVQINYRTYYGSEEVGGLNAFGTTTTGREPFNGNPFDNLVAGARILNGYGGGRTAAGRYRTGTGDFSRTRRGRNAFNARARQYDTWAPVYEAFFNCMRALR